MQMLQTNLNSGNVNNLFAGYSVAITQVKATCAEWIVWIFKPGYRLEMKRFVDWLQARHYATALANFLGIFCQLDSESS